MIVCDNCPMRNIFWIRPDYDTSFIGFDEFQNTIFKNQEDRDLLKSSDKVGASMPLSVDRRHSVKP